MNSIKLAKYNNSIVVILWGLIFSKCFVLEYFVQFYSVPINSTIYVWALTLWMAAVATFAFLRLNSSKYSIAVIPKWIIINWISCGIIAVLILAVIALSATIALDLYSIPALLALILGIGYLIHGFLSRKLSYTLLAIGWWTGAVILFIQSNMSNLLLFAFLILLLSVCPIVLEMKQQQLAFCRKEMQD